MIDKQTARDILSMALSKGGEFAELFIENKVGNYISFVNGKTDESNSNIAYGLGLRIFNGLGAIYSYTNDLSRSNLLKMAQTSAEAINKTSISQVLNFTHKKIENIHPVKIMAKDVSKKDIVNIFQIGSGHSFKFNSKISETFGSYVNITQDVCIINSEGLWAEDRRVRTQIRLGAIASDGSEKQASSEGPGSHQGYELVNSLNIKELAETAAKTAVTMLEAGYAPKGKMPVVINKGFGGVIFHEACGHSLEATAIAKGASEFYGKLGRQIASPCVTAVDDGTIPNYWGSQNIDDEGTPTRRNVLIENGILKSYLIDRLNGLKMGMSSTGSSRRESYRYAPTSRMTNTFIQAGNDKEEDIIKDTEYGLYAHKMGGGSVNTATGEYNFAVLEAYMIRDGKIAEPVRGASLIGKGAETLMLIDRVADNETQGPGMCGSISGSIPANCGQPMIRVKEITVGGRN
ncbi:MAG: TldD/PmbA family protein [Defluviitaleaceae bacterium]|nr:TldD/PmbA family protein [Defluviitaleaceae bacterium]